MDNKQILPLKNEYKYCDKSKKLSLLQVDSILFYSLVLMHFSIVG
jgi:hypothetical protein